MLVCASILRNTCAALRRSLTACSSRSTLSSRAYRSSHRWHCWRISSCRATRRWSTSSLWWATRRSLYTSACTPRSPSPSRARSVRGVERVLQKVKGREVEVGWGWRGEGESVEGLGMDWLSISHRAHDGGLPLDDPDAEVLGLHLLALLVGYGEPAEVLVRPVRVPLRPGVVSVMVAVVVVNSWRCRSGGQGFPVVGSPQRFGRELGWGDKGVSCGHCMQDESQGVAHWVVSADGGRRGVLGKEGRDVEREGEGGGR